MTSILLLWWSMPGRIVIQSIRVLSKCCLLTMITKTHTVPEAFVIFIRVTLKIVLNAFTCPAPYT